MKKSEVTIVIPTYNEAKTIESILKELKKKYGSILIVDSIKSKDNIEKIAGKYGVSVIKDNGFGKGEAIRCAISYLKDGIGVFIDADGSHITDDIEKLVRPIQEGKAQLVIASRFKGGSMELFDGSFNSFMRTFFTMCISLIINLRFGSRIADAQNGFRALDIKTAKKLNFKADKFDIETEEVMKCLKHNYKVMEIPSCELAREDGGSRINLWKMWHHYMWRVFVNLF